MVISLPCGTYAIYLHSDDILRHCSRFKTCKFTECSVCSSPNELCEIMKYEKTAKKERIVNGISVNLYFSILLKVCGMK